MERRTAVAVLVLLVALGGVALFGIVQLQTAGGSLSERWVSDTATSIRANHHAPAVPAANGSSRVYAPISGAGDSRECALLALDARDGSERWAYPIPAEHCTLHAVADPTVADFDGDDAPEVLAATTEREVVALDARTGDAEFRQNLSSYGYTKPLVDDLDGDGAAELVVVDVRGTAYVVEPNGTVQWRERHDAYTWAQPALADVDGDGTRDVVIATGDGRLLAYDASGQRVWNLTPTSSARISWMTTVNLPGRDAAGVAVAAIDGSVAVVAGDEGAVAWQRTFGSYAAVHATGDGDGDGRRELYVVARDGRLRSVDVADGTTEWTTTLTTADVQMMPPPSLGDLDDDGDPELVAPGNDGAVSVVDPSSGAVLATYQRDVPIYTHATVADADGDGVEEAYVIYGDGRLAALSYES